MIVTKADRLESEDLDAAAFERFRATLGASPPLVVVSALTRRNLDKLAAALNSLVQGVTGDER